MNNYEKVFSLIRTECEKQRAMAEISCFDRIAHGANISITRLPVYLNHLQELGLIKYSMKEGYMYLTEQGRKYQPEMLKTDNGQPVAAR